MASQCVPDLLHGDLSITNYIHAVVSCQEQRPRLVKLSAFYRNNNDIHSRESLKSIPSQEKQT